MLFTALYLTNKRNQYMNKLLLAEQIVDLLEIPSQMKRVFVEDIDENQFLHEAEELTSLIHTELLLANSLDDLKARLIDKKDKIQTIINILNN